MNESILKADIFFVVTTVAVVLVSIGIVVALVYLIRILSDMKLLSKKTLDEGGKIIDDVRAFREETEDKATSFNKLGSLFSIFNSKKKHRIKSSKK